MNDPDRGHRLGYTRVSSEDQNTVRQLDELKFDKVFTDKVSGGNAHRPQLTALLSHAREGTPWWFLGLVGRRFTSTSKPQPTGYSVGMA